MKKRFWRIEYSLTLIVIFAIALMLVPTQFITSKEASYISKWNDTYHKVEYIFSAMHAQEDSEVVKSFKRAKTNEARESLMRNLVKPHLRISEDDAITKKYAPHYMNGNKVAKNDKYYIEKFYLTRNDKLIGIKDIKNNDVTLKLFCNATSQMSSIRMYKYKIWDNNILVRNFVPVIRKSDNVAGMYDIVTKQFFENAGTGTFNYG